MYFLGSFVLYVFSCFVRLSVRSFLRYFVRSFVRSFLSSVFLYRVMYVVCVSYIFISFIFIYVARSLFLFVGMLFCL